MNISNATALQAYQYQSYRTSTESDDETTATAGSVFNTTDTVDFDIRNKFISGAFSNAPASVNDARAGSLSSITDELNKAMQEASEKAGISGQVSVAAGANMGAGPLMMFVREDLLAMGPINTIPLNGVGQVLPTTPLTSRNQTAANNATSSFSEAFESFRQLFRDASRNTAIGKLAAKDDMFAAAYDADPQKALSDYADALNTEYAKTGWTYTP